MGLDFKKIIDDIEAIQTNILNTAKLNLSKNSYEIEGFRYNLIIQEYSDECKRLLNKVLTDYKNKNWGD